MILKQMKVEGFKSFSEKQEFNFGSQKGLYSLSGINEVDTSLGSNGAGKSSIWDALCWVLYGKTVRGLKAGDLLTWFTDKKGFNVELDWENNSIKYKLRRAWNPNKLLLTIGGNIPQEVEQSRIDEVFGIPYSPFLFSVVMGQSRPMFFDLKESNKATLFSEVFQLDKWIDLSDKASADAKELESLLVSIDKAIAVNGGKIVMLQGDLDKFKDLKETWSEDSLGRVSVLLEKSKAAKKVLKVANKQLKIAVKDKQLIEIDSKTVFDEMKRVSEVIYKTEDRIKAVAEEMVQDKSHININKKDEEYFRKFSKGGNYPCTLCGQPIDGKYASKQIITLRQNIHKEGLKYHDRVVEKKTWKRSLNKALEELKELQIEDRGLSKDLGQSNSDIAFIKGEIKSTEKEVNTFQEIIDGINDEVNPFNSSIRNTHTDIYYVNIEVTKLNRIYKCVQEKREQTAYWIKGFKEIRLYMISEFITQLEIEVNSALSKLGLPDWEISFDIEKETKSKTIRKGFHVLIHSPLNDKPVPWESWSGGESQRLRLAGNMGLSSLILTQYGVLPNIEIWDEPSSHLGKEGVNDLLETLYDRAQLSDKCLWIIEHNALDFSSFVKNVIITKTKNGSLIN